MSSKAKEKKEHILSKVNVESIIFFRESISCIVQSFASFFGDNENKDLYTGEENIPFNQRHPIFKAIMKLEFQEALRDFTRT